MLRTLLRPLAWIYEFITTVRNYFFDKNIFQSYQACLPVISVGNITVGGTGKTPLCIAIAKQAKSLNLKPVILLRGYKGSARAPLLVAENHTVKIVGDEAKQYFESQITVVVAKSRVAGAKFIESHQLGNLIVLDDGFQHRWLARDLDIVCVNTDNNKNIAEFNQGDVLPLGWFRENKKNALKRVDILVLTNKTGSGCKIANLALRDLPQNIKIYNSSVAAEFNKPFPKADQALAFCAIGNPEGFFETLKRCGIKDFTKKIYPDHYEYTREDLAELTQKYPLHIFICTEKDWVKVRNFRLENIFYLKIEAVVDQKFFEDVFAAVKL